MRAMARGLAAGVALLTGSVSTGASAETLQEALSQAYATSPRLQAARAELEAVREELAQANGGWKPTFGATGGVTFNDVSTNVRSERFRTSRAGLRLVQNLYAGGGTLAEVESATNLVARQEALVGATTQDLFLDVISAYTALAREQQIQDASEANVARLQEQFGGTQKRFKVGEATRTDIAQAEARVVGALADRAQSRSNLAAAIAAYERLVGARPATLTTAPFPEAMPKTPDDALALADNNPNVQAAQKRLAQAEADVDVAFADFLPNVDLEGDFSYVDQPSIFTDHERDAAVGLQIQIPFYQRGVVAARLRQTKQIVQQRRRELVESRRLVAETILGTFENLRATNDQVDFYRQQVDAYQRALDGVKREVEIGNRSIINVLDAEQDLFGAQVSLERSIREQYVSAYTLKRAVGELDPAAFDLGPPPAVTD